MINAGTVAAYLVLDAQKYSGPLQRAKEQLQAFSKENATASEKLKGVGSAMGTVGQTATMGLTLPLVGAGTVVSKLAMDFEDGLAQIGTIADTSSVSLEKIGEGIKKLSKDTNTSLDDLTEAEYQAISAGVKTADSVEYLGKAVKLAKGGFTDITTAVNTTTTYLNAYGLEAKEVTRISDELIVAQNFGECLPHMLETAC